MVLSEDSEDHLFKKHQELCSKLNLDVSTVKESWERFQNMATNFSLEGEPLHWLGCAVFVTCKKTSTPTVGRSLMESSCVNITSLLRHCNFSLTQFFNKISRWAEMANMSDEFRSVVKRLEGSFAVSYNIFKKYTPIFNEIFKGPIEIETSKQPRNRKQRTPPCTPTKLFEFCWILFITAKGKNPQYSEDIVTSFHLLVACCDLIFKNAFLDNRKDLINANFPELPLDWLDANFTAPSEAPCIVNYLCEKHNGTSTDAKYVKEYSWKELIDEMFTRGLLQGIKETFTDLLEPGNFEINLKNLTKMYESQLLSRGDFDERIFMAEYRRRLMLNQQPGTANGAFSFTSNYFSGDCLLTNSPRAENPNLAKRLTTKSVSRLQTLLSGRHSGPSSALIQIFQSCSSDPTNKIKQLVDEISEKVRAEFGRQVSFDHVHQLAVTLFYKFVENIFQKEKKLHNDISPLTDKLMFYECTLACCFEIVIYSYGFQKKYPFPWILTCLELQPFYFVRVIELIVRSTDQLPREAVKHLNMVEQKIFEYLIWKSDSLLWEALKNSKEEFPKFEDTALPGNLIYNEEQTTAGNATPRTPNDQLQSPGPSAIDRFQSPIVNTCTLVEVKKQLFKSTTKHILVIDQNGKQFLPIVEKSAENAPVKIETPQVDLPPPPPVNLGRPKKTGSLYIILRKFYNLAYSRMEQLCNQLDIGDMKFRQKIWTVFEHSIREHTDLMRDRNLDQLLMCAVYVVCKVTGARERKFAEIMEHYRSQPQASSHIYRNVLISREGEGVVQEDEQRGDLISFYNTVYVQAMKSFALQFSFSTSQNCNITLSPLPLLINNNLVSPRCHVSNNLYITPYNTPTNSFGKGKTLDYHFSRSPCRDLKKINTALNGKIVGKRLLNDDNNADAPPNKRVATKMQSIMEQRRSLATE